MTSLSRISPSGDEIARLATEFIDHFELMQTQMALFEPIARKLIQELKGQRLNKESHHHESVPLFNPIDADDANTGSRFGESMKRATQSVFFEQVGGVQEDRVEDEWIQKMDRISLLPEVESQFIGKASTKNMIFEAVEDGKKSRNLIAESIHELDMLKSFDHPIPNSNKRASNQTESFSVMPEVPAINLLGRKKSAKVAQPKMEPLNDTSMSSKKESRQQTSTITETRGDVSPGSKIHSGPILPTHSPAVLMPSPPPRVTKMGLNIKKFMVGATYNDRGSNVSIHDHVVIRDKQRNAIFDSDPYFIWNHGMNSMSSFSVLCEFLFFVVCTSELVLLPLAISYDFSLPLFYSCFISIVNLFDILLELITMKYNHPAVASVKDPTIDDWRAFYYSRVLLIDIVTVIPFELLSVPGSHYLWGIRLLRMHKLPYIARTSPIFAKLKKILLQQFGVGQFVSPIFPLAAIFLLFMHVQACVIFLAGRLFEFSNHEIEPYKDASIFDQYMWSLYMSATNIFPLGYHPVNSLEQFITVVFVVCGAALYACIVGAISSIAIGVDASGRLYKQKIDELKEYMHWKAVEPVTQRKVLKYYELKYRGKYFEEAELLNRMNESLRMEISIHNCRELISKVPFLFRDQGDGRDDLFAGRITSALEPCYYVPGDIVFVQGEIGHDMYFIFSGAVLVSISGKGVAILRDGAFFGEIALVANIPRTATVQAVSSCVLYRLRQESFDKIVNAFDDVKKKVDAIYVERMEKIRLDEELRKVQVANILVSKIPFMAIEDKDRNMFIEKLVRLLVPVTFSADEVVCTQGELIDCMYTIKTGKLNASNDNQKFVLIEGDYFGDTALMIPPRSMLFTYRAATVCMCYRLPFRQFQQLLDEYPYLKKLAGEIL